jgi:hypothetical protein
MYLYLSPLQYTAGQVKKGEKYIYQKWFYQKPILPQYQDDVSDTLDISF